MVRKILSFFVLLFAGQLQTLAAAPFSAAEVQRMAAPDWVEPVDVDLAGEATGESGGSTSLLWDGQVNAREKTGYFHFAKRFLTESAVENGARITITFDPSYQTLAFHQLVIHRGGKAIDRLSAQEIKLLQREERLDWNLYDGQLSAVLIPDDIRVGDVVEYAYSIRGANPIFGGRFMAAFSTRWTEPLRHMKYRLLWPGDRKLQIKAHVEELAPAISSKNGLTEYVWDRRNVPALISDGELPSWSDAWSWVQLSEFQNWHEVAAWAVSIFNIPSETPEDLSGEMQAISALGNEEARVIAALRYVQDKIRYLGVEVGPNSHQPHSVESILQRRFGDCKDKALLLTTMLRKLGFNACPALVNTEAQAKVADYLPTALAFDHAIVHLSLRGKSYWLDATASNQGGGLDQLYTPDYGLALLVEPNATALAALKPSGFAESSIEVAEAYDFQNYAGNVSLRVHTTYRGGEADNLRSSLASHSQDEIRKSYLNYYARAYPHIKPGNPPRFQDDRAKNVLICDESYVISEFWQPDKNESDRISGEFSAVTIRELPKRPDTPVRTMPLAVKYPARVTQVIEVNLPEVARFKREKSEVSDPAFHFSYAAEPSEKRLTLRYDYEALADNVPASATARYVSKLENMWNMTSYVISVPAKSAKLPFAGTGLTSADVQTPALNPAPTGFAGNPTAWVVLSAILAGGIVLFFRDRRKVPPAVAAETQDPLHRCVVCGKTEESDGSIEFRVSGDGEEYCMEHLRARRRKV